MAKTKSKSRTVAAPPKPPPVVLPPRDDDDALLDTANTAVWLGVSHQWLELARFKGYGPRYVKITSRLVRYRMGDLREYLRSRTTDTTMQEHAR